VVASDSGELPRVIQATDGGWVVPEGDAQALASRLEALRQAPEELAGQRRQAHATVLEHFHDDVIARRFAKMMETVARPG
jgi:glycosyltransferase involved in cell wall biosynthesis